MLPLFLIVSLLSPLQGDVGPTGPPGPIGETGHGLPGPKVNLLNKFVLLCIFNHMHTCAHACIFITFFSTRVNEVIQDCRVHLVQKVKVSLAPWFVLSLFYYFSCLCLSSVNHVQVSIFSTSLSRVLQACQACQVNKAQKE